MAGLSGFGQPGYFKGASPLAAVDTKEDRSIA